MRKSVALLLSLSVVSACGGSSDTVNISTSALRIFSDGAGVGYLESTVNGESRTGYVITPFLTEVLADIEGDNEVPDYTLNVPQVGTGPNTIISEGTATIEGTTVNVLAVTTTEGDVGSFVIYDPILDFSILGTEGPIATGIPTSGDAIYAGTFGIGLRLDTSSIELGTFLATVDFDDPTPVVDFDGFTTNYSVTGLATVSGGSFSSSLITIETPFGGSVSGSLNGDFHDADADDMAGVIYSNDTSGTYVGAFVGSK